MVWNWGEYFLVPHPPRHPTFKKGKLKILYTLNSKGHPRPRSCPPKQKPVNIGPVYSGNLCRQKKKTFKTAFISDQEINWLCLIKYLQAELLQTALFFHLCLIISLCNYSTLIFYISFFFHVHFPPLLGCQVIVCHI